jgi:hypothetical protein
MVHIIYGLVYCENFVGDEVCRIVKKVENTALNVVVLKIIIAVELRIHFTNWTKANSNTNYLLTFFLFLIKIVENLVFKAQNIKIFSFFF